MIRLQAYVVLNMKEAVLMIPIVAAADVTTVVAGLRQALLVQSVLVE